MTLKFAEDRIQTVTEVMPGPEADTETPPIKLTARSRVLEFFYRAVTQNLCQEARNDPDLQDAAKWAGYQIKLFTELFEARELKQPSAAVLLLNSHHPEIPSGYTLPTIFTHYPKVDDPGELLGFYFGLCLDDPLASLRKSLAAEQAPTKRTGIALRIKVLEDHSVPSAGLEDSAYLEAVVAGVARELRHLGSQSDETRLLANAQKFVTGRMLMLPPSPEERSSKNPR